MALYSSTLIIKYQTDKTDLELIKALKLYAKPYHYIGPENTSYIDALSGPAQMVYVTSTDEYVIIVGLPLVNDFVHINQYNHVFPGAEFFFTVSETTSMLHCIFYGKGDKIIRKKYVQNGRYFRGYDIDPDLGELFEEEKTFIEDSDDPNVKLSNKDYMFGVHDFDISMKAISRIFRANPNEFLERLTFNKNISDDAGYVTNSNHKVNETKVNAVFEEKLKLLAKASKFKKFSLQGTFPNLIKSLSYWKDLPDMQLYILANKWGAYSIAHYSFVLSTDVIDKELFGTLFHGSFGVPILTIDPIYEIKLNPNANDYIYTANDLAIAEQAYEANLDFFKNFLNAFGKGDIHAMFSKANYQFVLAKLKHAIKVSGKMLHKHEINFCLLYCYFSKEKSEIQSLIDLLDSIRAEDKISLHVPNRSREILRLLEAKL